MIVRTRTLTVLPEKAEAYRALLIRAATYLSEQYAEIQVEILENVAGSRRQLHMVTRCDSLAALERYEKERKDDADWLALIEEAQALQATVDEVDHLYRVIE